VQEDASQRIGVDPDAVRVVSVDPVDWLDDSLGCGAPPVPAPETRVPGYRVTVDAAGTVLIYHTDGKDRIRVCNGE
jgi:hypothetical protein